MKPWATKVLAVIVLALGYVLQHGVIPPGYKWHGISIAGVVADALTTFAALGISGPQLWPQLAAMLGNGAAKSPEAPKS